MRKVAPEHEATAAGRRRRRRKEKATRKAAKTDDGADTATLISDPVLEAGVFAHVAATWDGSMMRIYKDGVEVASQEKGGTAVAVDPDISAAMIS